MVLFFEFIVEPYALKNARTVQERAIIWYCIFLKNTILMIV